MIMVYNEDARIIKQMQSGVLFDSFVEWSNEWIDEHPHTSI